MVVVYGITAIKFSKWRPILVEIANETAISYKPRYDIVGRQYASNKNM